MPVMYRQSSELDADGMGERHRSSDHRGCQGWWRGSASRSLLILGYGGVDERQALAFHVGGQDHLAPTVSRR
jgi:hypothetical protein